MATQEIGLPIKFETGTFNNTIVKDGKLQLAELKKDDKSNIVYAPFGFWESQLILIQDKITSFKRIAKDIEVKGDATYKIYTKSSVDGTTWTEYAEIDNADGSTHSPAAKYAKVKVEIIPPLIGATFTVDEFTDAGKYANEFVNSDNGVLELKKHYRYKYAKDESWKDEGVVLRKKIPSSKLKKIDLLRVEV
ncbi:hypothetical protein LQV63_09965 [Paenibacillus profundus]|uniref:F5/8 type C domain-containing protein n=1 Tax=Paenibacillus profundus TaxID=1173085 RepID=A0ABS8YC92_9BACL|nr:hypothetical protein [Paenibacillus profundus]MCE5169638.1 hypothetical protein [Paenibacillus profundus]